MVHVSCVSQRATVPQWLETRAHMPHCKGSYCFSTPMSGCAKILLSCSTTYEPEAMVVLKAD